MALEAWLNESTADGATQPTTTPAGAPVTNEPTLGAPTFGESNLSRWYSNAEQAGRLDLSMREAAARDPERTARVLRLQARTGLPSDLIDRNLDSVEQEATRADFDADRFRRQSPIAAEWLAEHPDNAAVARDDLERLGVFERLLNSLKRGTRSALQSESALKTSLLADRIAAIEALNQLEDAGAEVLPMSAVLGVSEPTPEQKRATQYPEFRRMSRAERDEVLAGFRAAVGRHVGDIASDQQRIEKIPLDPQVARAHSDGTFATWFYHFTENPANYILQIGAQSAPQMVPGLVLGAVAGPAGLGIGSYAQDYGASFVEALREEGVDVTDRAQVDAAVANQELMQRAMRRAAQHAGPVAALDTVSAGVASKVLAPARLATRPVARELTNIAAQAPIQGTLGAVGEAAGQAAQDKELDAAEIAAEFVGEFVTTPADVGVLAINRGRARVREIIAAKERQDLFKALGDTAEASTLRERLPEKLQEFVARATQDGPVEDVYLPVDSFTTLYQGAGLDPRAAAAELTGDPRAYDQAVATGGELRVPLARYAVRIAPTPLHAKLAPELRLGPETLSAREANELARAEREAAQTSAPADPAAAVREDVVGQLLGAGFERGTAETYAALYESTFRTLGQRAGVDPQALYQRYRLTIARELPAVLQQAGTLDNLDVLIDRLRTGDIPSERDIRGPSLLDYLVQAGGLQDQGGELSARDAAKSRRGLVRATGRTLDDAAEAAVEAGYLAERDPNQLLEAIDQELRGQPVYSPARPINPALAEARATLEQLGQYLGQVNVDLATTDNDTIKRLLRAETETGTGPAMVLTQDKRGYLRFGDRRFDIRLLEKADLSTFLHETGHFYLEVLADLAQAPNASDQMRADYQAVLDWLGVTSRAEVTMEHHERWARGFEAYLFEGKSPSTHLARVFARFRAWLIAIYRRLARLNVELTDDVRGVLDRLVATEEEINAARERLGVSPLFTDAQQAGMTAAEFSAYQEAVDAARQAAEAELAGVFIAEQRRAQESWWKQTREQVRTEVAAEVNQQKTYIALEVLQHGRLPNGGALPEGMWAAKLSRRAIVELLGENFLKRLPRPYVYVNDGGASPDVLAEVFGFNSGEELLLALANARPRTELIEAETDARMRERFGDKLLDGTIAADAMAAVHNDARGELLLLELTKLAGRTRQRVTPLAVLREQVERTIATKRVRDVQPALYQRAEAKAARAAFAALGRGDYATAFIEKQRELMNHELYRAAARARTEVDGIVEYMGRFNRRATRERLGLAGADYLEQIDTILERFDFRKAVSLEAIDRRKGLAAWIEEQNELGFTVSLPPRLLNEAYRRHYKDTAVEELVGIRDTVRTIEHLARTKNQLLANQRTQDLAAAREEIVSAIAAHHTVRPDAPDFAPGLKSRIKETARGFFAAHTKLEFLFEYLDGNKAQGPVWQHLFKPFADAEATENRMMRDVVTNLSRIFGAYARRERATWFFRKTYIPAIGTALTKANMLAVALNWGNAYNREALMRGYSWDERQVQAVLAHLDKRDWDTVQAIWDYIDSFWPQIETQERALTGLAPAKVEPAAVVTSHGTYRGGYYPVIFDSKRSWRQSVLEEKANVRDLFGGHWARAMTRHGHAIERTDTGGKPLRLDLSGLTEHLTNVVHDLAFRRPLIDVGRLANDQGVREAIEGALGREYYRQVNPWLVAMAADRRDTSNPIEGLLGRARAGATVVNMGWKLTTALVQPLGFTVSIKELGAKYAARGLADVYGRPTRFAETWRYVTERSDFMATRLRTYDRDVRDALKRLNVAGVKPGALSVVDAYTAGVRESYFVLIGYMDMAVSLPTWMGAYRKALDGAIDNVAAGDERAAIDYADQVVRETQGSGAAKDLALVQRGPEALRIFTMFYSYFSVLFNQLAKTGRQYGLDRNVPRLLASLVLLWFVPAVLEQLLLGRAPDEDADEEEWLKWLLKQEAAYPFQSVVLVRDVVNGMDRYGYEPSAAFDMYESLARSGRLAIALSPLGDKEDVTRSDVKGLALATGYALQLPSRQLWLTGEYVYDWMGGDVDPEHPAEAVWRGLVTGAPRE